MAAGSWKGTMAGATAFRQDSGLYDEGLDWYLTCRDAACGYASALGPQIVTIERGISASRTPTSDPYRSDQVGFGPKFHGRGAFSLDRTMRRRWTKLDRRTREVLLAHYVALVPTPNEPGAEWQPGKPVPNGEYSTDYSTARYRRELTGRTRFPAGVDARLGKLAGAALFLTPADELARLLKACERGNEAEVTKARRRAEAAVRRAHAAYWAVVAAEGDAPEEVPEGNWRRNWLALERKIRGRDALPDVLEVMASETVNDFARRGTDGVWR